MAGRRLTTAFLCILALIGCRETEQVQTGDEVSAMARSAAAICPTSVASSPPANPAHSVRAE
jgi:hypothetical protein